MADATLNTTSAAPSRASSPVHVFPASFEQQRLWLLERFTPGLTAYNLPAAIRIDGPVDRAALQRAVDALVRRHDSFRTSFHEVEGAPVQAVAADCALPVNVLALAGESDPDAALHQALADEMARPFDLASAPLARFLLAQLGSNRNVLAVICHHAIADGPSLEVLFRDVWALYATERGRPAVLPRLPLQYGDFATWQRRTYAEHAVEGLTYWRHALRDLPGPLPLPRDRERLDHAAPRAAAIPVEIDRGRADQLRIVAAAYDTTLFVVLLAAWQAVLHRHSGAADLTVGSPVSSRHDERLRQVIGFFANTVVFQARFGDDPTLDEHLRRVRATVTKGLAHADVPFDRVVSALAPERQAGRQPLYQVLFGLDTVDEHRHDEPATPPRVPLPTGGAKADLTLTLVDSRLGIEGMLEYDADAFEPGTADAMRQSMFALLDGMVNDPQQRVSAVLLISPAAEACLLHTWNDSERPYPRDASVPALVAAQASRTPDAVAVEDGRTVLTYVELERRARQVAGTLRGQQIGPGDRVGVLIERSADLVVAWLAVLQAGAAYVPLDPEHPAARIALLINDAAVRVTIATRRTTARQPEGCRVLLLEDAVADVDGPMEPDDVPGDAPAYLVYTSGSTGTPKGAIVPHRAITRLAVATSYVELGSDDRVAFASNIAFDAATFEVWAPLLTGGRAVIVPREVLLEPSQLAAFLRERRITTMFLTTALFNQVVADRVEAFATLRHLLVGGEMADPNRFRAVLQHGAPGRLIHVYGPTETTTFATAHHVTSVAEGARLVPIGRPIGHTRAYVIDRHQRLVPVGVTGELVIAGDGVALGYWQRPELTATAFIEDRWSVGGGRGYRTGDLVRWHPGGVLEILGRLDEQVKIRGFRVEPGEVEAELARAPGVEHAVVATRRNEGEARLVAYLVLAPGATIAGIREHVRSRLPAAFVPSAFVSLTRLPLTPNGKVDRAALPAPESRPADCERALPTTAHEATLARIWAEVLGLDTIGVHDNFFDIGGDSIRAIQVASRAARAGLEVRPRHLFDHQTIATLAAAVAVVAPAAEQELVTGEVPLTPIQAWLLAEPPEELHHFNQAVTVDLPAGIGRGALEQAMQALVRHHDALRLRISPAESGWRQWIAPPDAMSLVAEHILPTDEAATEARHLAAAAQSSLDLADGPVVRAVLLRKGADGSALAVIFAHHLAVDLVSWRLLLDDLQVALEQIGRGEAVRFAARSASYKSWAERFVMESTPATTDDLAPWRGRHWTDACGVPLDSAPSDPAAVNIVAARREVTTVIDPETTAVLRTWRQDGVSVLHVVLGAITTALGAWTGRRAIALDVEGHGRDALGDAVDVTRTVGWFTELAPMQFECDADPMTLLRDVKRRLDARPRGGRSFGAIRYLAADDLVRKDAAAITQPQVSVNYLGEFRGRSARPIDPEPDSWTGPTRSPRGRCRHLLDIEAGILDGALSITWGYCATLHDEATVARVANQARSTLVDWTARLGRRVSAAAGAAAPVEAPIDTFGLSPLQQGMLFHAELAPRSGEYVVVSALPLAGPLDSVALRRAWEEVLAATPILRTSFLVHDSGSVQRVHRRVPMPWHEADWRALSRDSQEAQFRQLLERERMAGFDHTQPPLMRCTLVRMADDRFQLVWACHHLIIDGWSRPLLLDDVTRAYAQVRAGEPVRLPARRPYQDYIRWLATRETEAGLGYWRAALESVMEPTLMAPVLASHARQDDGTRRYESRRRVLSAEATARIEVLARHAQVTLGTVLHAAWALIVCRYTRSTDVVFGSTVAGRPPDLDGSDAMIGPFINTVPLRVRIEAWATVGKWLADVQQRLVNNGEFAWTPLVETMACAGVDGGPLFDSLVVVENYPGSDAAGGASEEPSVTEWTSFPVTFSAVPGNRLTLEITCATDIDRVTMDALLDQIACALQEMAADASQHVDAVALMTSADVHRLLRHGSRPAASGQGPTIYERFHDTCLGSPSAPAIVTGGATITYGALLKRVDDLVAQLRRRGIGPGDRVGLVVSRGPHYPCALLAVIAAGATCVPCDPEAPAARLAWLLADADVRLVLTAAGRYHQLTAITQPILDMEESGDTPSTAGDHAEGTARLAVDQAACIIYTSGSTGEPKGVLIAERAIAAHAAAIVDEYALTRQDRVLHCASPAFDVAIEEVVPTLLNGGTVVAWEDGGLPSIAEFTRFLTGAGVTVANLPTPYWHEWVDDLDRGGSVPECLRLVVVGTDTASPEALVRWRARVGDRVAWVNAYGCTEATVTSTTYRGHRPAAGGDGWRVPIGRPVAGSRAYVVDDQLRLLPPGVPGELVIAGAGVALGYWQRRPETDAKFLSDRWAEPDGRAYRTGDLARWRHDGELELLGRIDAQIKLRGFRIEPAEIEAAIAREDAIGQAAVVPVRRGQDVELVAYVVAERPLVTGALRSRLGERLPRYMVPAHIIQLERLPLTANGKLDRARLPPPPAMVSGRPATTAMERTVAAIWGDVLAIAPPGADAHFFELGGHSLAATRMVSRLRAEIGMEVPLRTVFEHPTLAEFVASLPAATAPARPTHIPPRSVSGPAPLSVAQERLWFLDHVAGGAPVYNLPCSLRISGTLDAAALQGALDDVVARHEALRTAFVVMDSRPMQLVAPSLHVPLRTVDLSTVPGGEREEAARAAARQDTQARFDLEHGPLIRAVLLRMEADGHVLIVTMHHIVSDGWSVSVFLNELQTCYQARTRGRQPRLRPLPVQYADYALWQRSQLDSGGSDADLAYWRMALDGMPAALELPTDRPRPPRRRFRGACDTAVLGPALTARLTALAAGDGATPFMVILAAWQLVLSRWSGQDDVAVGVPVAGRRLAETEPLIGFFLNNLVMRTRLDGNPTFRELLARVREVALGAFEHQEVPFERLLVELTPPRDPARTPLFQVFLNVLNFAEERLDLPDAIADGFSLAPPPAEGLPADGSTVVPQDISSQFDITLYAGERDGQLRIVLVYDTDLFDHARMVDMLDQLVSVFGQIVDDPERRVSDISLLTPRMSAIVPDPTAPLDDTWKGSVYDCFRAHAVAAADRIAIEGDGPPITYAELDRLSGAMARALQARGVVRGDVVAIVGARCARLVVSLLAIMRTGAAFTIIDPKYPAPRVRSHVALARPRLIVTLTAGGTAAETLATAVADLVPSLSEARIADAGGSSPAVTVAPDDVACVGFTSGSTGVPKAILGRHGPLTHFVPWMASTFALDHRDRYSLLAGLSHDPLQREIFTPLSLGATIVVPPPAAVEDPVLVATWLAEAGITVAHLTPALGQLVLQGARAAGGQLQAGALRRAFFVGDVLRGADAERLSSLAPGIRIVNMYGSTETQRAVGYHVAPAPDGGHVANRALPLGRGMQDVQLLVLSDTGRLCGLGERGEIHVRSPHLARGYLGDDALTDARFLVNPATGLADDRLYRTGDLGRYLIDGEVAFAGRADTQLKIRGFRVEPAEVEAALVSHDAIGEAAVVPLEGDNADDDRRLAAYVVSSEGKTRPEAEELRTFIADRLPSYMVPADVIWLGALPLTPNGKLDTRALPRPAVRVEEPRDLSPMESAVAELWRALPGVRASSAQAGFFESGGHSLLSMLLLSRINAAFAVDLTIGDFLRAPTIAGLAAAIERSRTSRRRRSPLRRVPRRPLRARLGPDGGPVLSTTLCQRLMSLTGGLP